MAAFTLVKASRRARAASLIRVGLPQDLRSILALAALEGHALLDEVEGAAEGVVGVVRGEDGERFGAALDLLLASLDALLVLGVRVLAGLLEVHEELLVRREGVAG